MILACPKPAQKLRMVTFTEPGRILTYGGKIILGKDFQNIYGSNGLSPDTQLQSTKVAFRHLSRERTESETYCSA